MTLQNGLIHAGRAYLWTDTAAWNPTTGQQIGHLDKAITGLLWPWAVVHSGLMRTTDNPIFARLTDNWSLTSERLLQTATAALRQEAAEGRHGRLLIAHTCQTYGARMFLISTEDEPFTPAFTPYETIEYMSSGNGTDFAAEFAGRDMTPADMRRFIEHQTTHPCEKLVGGTFVGIGGNIIEIEVQAKGVQSRVVSSLEHLAA